MCVPLWNGNLWVLWTVSCVAWCLSKANKWKDILLRHNQQTSPPPLGRQGQFQQQKDSDKTAMHGVCLRQTNERTFYWSWHRWKDVLLNKHMKGWCVMRDSSLMKYQASPLAWVSKRDQDQEKPKESSPLCLSQENTISKVTRSISV